MSGGATVLSCSRRLGESRGDNGEGSCHRLMTVIDGAAMGRVFEIGEQPVVLGRDAGCDIVLDERSVSRRHGLVRVRADGEVELRDLGSTNGSYVNGARVVAAVLDSGDTVRLGARMRLRFGVADTVEVRLRELLFDAATIDVLTGAYNQRYFRRRMEEEFGYAERHGDSLGVIVLDLDGFKAVNDTFGHLAGDELLARVAEVVSSTIRREDVLCRNGGDELAILVRQPDPSLLRSYAARIRRRVAEAPLIVDIGKEPRRIEASVSAGVAVGDPRSYRHWRELVAAADRDLYRAKAARRERPSSVSAAGR